MEQEGLNGGNDERAGQGREWGAYTKDISKVLYGNGLLQGLPKIYKYTYLTRVYILLPYNGEQHDTPQDNKYKIQCWGHECVTSSGVGQRSPIDPQTLQAIAIDLGGPPSL